jgi:ArsR family transcriptional regulator
MGASKTELFTPVQRSFARTAKAIGHPARVVIIQHLMKVHYSSNIALTDIVGLSETTVHQHLQELRKAGMVSDMFIGKNHFYVICGRAVQQIENLKLMFEDTSF